MKITAKTLLALLVSVAVATYVGSIANAQAPAAKPAPPTGKAVPPVSGLRIEGNLLQVMRGVLYPASNVLFAAQSDISKLPPAEDPSSSPNPLTNMYGGWTAVENAAIAISEGANLLVLPGRLCSNGKPVPVQRADFQKYVQGLRDAGQVAYKAAQMKSTDAMGDAAGAVSDACSNCHNVYRDKPSGDVKDRCVP